jgi:hypothetical protein
MSEEIQTAISESRKQEAETAQIKLTTAGQRKINLIWEFTQAFLAVLVTFAMVYCEIFNIEAPQLTNAFFLIVGFYFSRTNHTARGGIGKQPAENR